MRFAGKAAIVTGGSRGIGQAIAELFGHDGAQVLVTYRENEAAAKAVVDRINSEGPGRAIGFRADVADPDQVRAMVACCLESFGHVDMLVNNAGYVTNASILDYSDADWRQTMGVNLDGTFYSMREVAPLMVKQGSGSIVNISSIAAFTGGANSAAYTASKMAVIGLTKRVALELAQYGIRVNAVAPGGTETDMVRGLGAAADMFKKLTPLGRLAQPSEIAAVVAFLCSEEASFITGECIRATGGR